MRPVAFWKWWTGGCWTALAAWFVFDVGFNQHPGDILFVKGGATYLVVNFLALVFGHYMVQRKEKQR
jgi:hypothetical protein